MEWRPIPREPGYYACSDGRIMGPTGTILRPAPVPTGHMYVTVTKGRSRAVHVMVMETFKGSKPAPMMLVMHGDDDPANNAIDNLSWGTSSQNLQDAYLRGRRPTKLCPDAVRSIRRDHASGTSQRALARKHGVTRRTIQQVVHRLTWRHV